MALTSDQRKSILEVGRRLAIANIAVLMVTMKKPQKDATAGDILKEAEELYDSFFGGL